MVTFQLQFVSDEDAQEHNAIINKALVGNKAFIYNDVTVSPVYMDETSQTWWFNVNIGECNGADAAIICETPSFFKMLQ